MGIYSKMTFTVVGALGVSVASAVGGGNVLVVVADDLGKEVLSIYNSECAQRAVTPNIDRLAQQGVVFDNFWGAPLSSPARAAMLTGRYGHRTGVVSLSESLSADERTLFDALPAGYVNAVIGKWHLSKDLDFARDYGVDYFAGLAMGGGVRSYNSWRYTKNGRTTLSTDYVTDRQTDDAIEWIESQRKPWLCWVAYNAPHTPFHIPPDGTHTRTGLKVEDELQCYLAMVENLDYNIGRLLEKVDENTTIIFVGDNGTDNGVLQSPYPRRHGKGTLYESGVSIPLVIAGRGVGVEGRHSSALGSAVDIFPTVLELLGEELPSYKDGYSLASVVAGGGSDRRYNFAEGVSPATGYHAVALSDGRYKVIAIDGKVDQLYDLVADPFEQHNLLQSRLSAAQQSALSALAKELQGMNIPKIERGETAQRERPQRDGSDNKRLRR